MIKRNRKTIGCVAALSLAAFSAHASTEEHALQACASALTGEISANSGIRTVYRLDGSPVLSKHRLEESAVYHLDAHDPDTNEVIARADCYVTGRAEVRKLIPLPLDSDDAMDRSMTAY